jgi:uncharacterized glyoxalase superfamily protein PhnB
MAKSIPVLSGLNLVARDMDATLAFYRQLGVEIPSENIWRTESGIHHVTASTPKGADLEFDSDELATGYNAGFRAESTPTAAARTIISFSLSTREGVDERYRDLVAAGFAGLQAPYDAFWGARYAVVEDPDGRHVGLVSPVDPARKTAPPSV